MDSRLVHSTQRTSILIPDDFPAAVRSLLHDLLVDLLDAREQRSGPFIRSQHGVHLSFTGKPVRDHYFLSLWSSVNPLASRTPTCTVDIYSPTERLRLLATVAEHAFRLPLLPTTFWRGSPPDRGCIAWLISYSFTKPGSRVARSVAAPTCTVGCSKVSIPLRHARHWRSLRLSASLFSLKYTGVAWSG